MISIGDFIIFTGKKENKNIKLISQFNQLVKPQKRSFVWPGHYGGKGLATKKRPFFRLPLVERFFNDDTYQK